MSVRTSITRRQVRKPGSPLGVHGSLPARKRELFCHAADRTRSSLVSSSWSVPGWGAFGGRLHGRTGTALAVSNTEPTPGTPWTVMTVKLDASVLCITRNRSLVLLSAWAGCTALRAPFGTTGVMESDPAHAVRLALLMT